VLFDGVGRILTNNHVVEGSIAVEIILSNRTSLQAEIVGTDSDTDLAVLRVDPAAVSEIVPVPLGDTDAMRNGDWVIAIGSPLGFDGSVTVGVISAKGRTLTIDADSPQLHDLVQTDAVINPGNSGGPLLNLSGEVIGINTAIIRGNIGYNQEAGGIGFAISMGTAIPVIDQILRNGRVIRPKLGIRIVDLTPALALDRGLPVDEGVLIVSVDADSPAERAGILPDDVIVAIDDTPVLSTSDLVRLFLTSYGVNDTIEVTVIRANRTLKLQATLDEIL
jgi:S1-C subfamily serine protease